MSGYALEGRAPRRRLSHIEIGVAGVSRELWSWINDPSFATLGAVLAGAMLRLAR